MKLVVDANELFSAVIAKGKGLKSKTLDIFFSDKVKLFAPYRILSELEKNREEIRYKAGFSQGDFDVFVSILKFRIDFIPLESFSEKLVEAKEISPHLKDIEFFALALKLGSRIWSEEKSFKTQEKVKTFNTDELHKELFEEPK